MIKMLATEISMAQSEELISQNVSECYDLYNMANVKERYNGKHARG